MKKVFLSLATLAFVLGGSFTVASCGGGNDDEKVKVITGDIEITADNTETYVGTNVTLKAMVNGEDVTQYVTFYANEEPIQGNTFTSDSEATFLVQAKKEGANDSNYLDISFQENPFAGISGTGSISYNGGQEHSLNGAYLYLKGFYFANEEQTEVTGWWFQYAWDTAGPLTSNNFIGVTFDVPATINEEGEVTDFEYPGESNSVFYSVVGALVNGEEIDLSTQETTPYTGTVVYNSLDMSQNPGSVNFQIAVSDGNNSFNFNYNGQIPVPSNRMKYIVSDKKKIKSYAQYKSDKAAFKKMLRK